MATGGDWRSAWGHLLHSDDDEERGRSESRRTSTTTEPSSFTYDERSSGDEDVDVTFGSSVSGVDALVYDDEVYRKISKMLSRDYRRSRAPKKSKDRQAYFKQNRSSQYKQNAARKVSRDAGLVVVTPAAGTAAASPTTVIGDDFLSDAQDVDEMKRSDLQKRKRTVEQLRTSERDAKWDIGELRTLDSSEGVAPPSQASLKVDTTNHFRSLNSKPVVPKDSQPSTGTMTPLKTECPQDRHEFWTLFSLLVRMGNPDRKNKEERNFTRQVRASSPPPEMTPLPVWSREEHVWQNRLNDLVWLSLRAWHSGRSIRDEDHVLCMEREGIRLVLDEIMNFTFRPSAAECCFPRNSSVSRPRTVPTTPDVEETLTKCEQKEPRRPLLQIPLPETNALNTSEAEWSTDYACSGLCSIFCQTCLANQNDALVQVKSLLERLDDVERLYPSSRAMRMDWELYQSTEFTARVKSLCLFFNLVTDLRHKIATLGKLQASIGSKNLPWPSFVPLGRGCSIAAYHQPSPALSNAESSSLDCCSLGDRHTGQSSASSFSGSGTDDKQATERKTSKCVRFQKAVEDKTNRLKLKVESLNGDGSSGDSGYGPASLTPTSTSPAAGITSPTTMICSSPIAALDSGGWSWSAAATPTQSGSLTPVTTGIPGEPATSYAACTTSPPSPLSLNRSFSDQGSDSGMFITPYRRYVDRLLKTKGLRKIFASLMDLIRNTLMRSKIALERIPASQRASVMSPDLPGLPMHASDASMQSLSSTTTSMTTSTTTSTTTANDPLHFGKSALSWYEDDNSEELRRYGPWGESFRQMELPSFRSLYLFLTRIPLDVMHECLQLRLEQQPRGPSSLSVRQLMRECKEAIKASVVVRQKFLRMTRTILIGSEMEHVERDIVEFDCKVERMLQSYLSYFQSWVQMLIKSGTQQQTTQKNVLEDEWTFVKVFSRYVQRGEAIACETFCSLACSMFESTGDNLESGLDKCTSLLYDSIGPTFSVFDRSAIRGYGGGGDTGGSSDSPDPLFGAAGQSRQAIWQCCREYKDAFQEARKRALKAISFAKMLRKDLEIAAEFRIEVSICELLDCLRGSGHVRLIAPHSSCFIIFIPGHIQDNRPYLWQLMSMTYGHEHSAAPDNVESEGYLIILRCENCGLVPGPWSGPTIVIEPTAEITITLSHLNVEGLLLVVNHSSQLGIQRKAFQRAMGTSIVTLTKEFTSCNHSIADSLGDLKREAIALQCKITRAIQDVENRLSMDSISDLEESDRSSLQSRFREVLHQCYKFGFEYQKEVTRLVTGESRSELGVGLIDFSNQWMRFVLERCERGRGVRPRWANQGLEFLMMACEPQYLKTVSDDEFQRLKQTMNDCIAHLIGSADNKMSPSPGGIGSRSHSPSTPHARTNFRQSSSYCEPSTRQLRTTTSTSTSRSEPMPSWNVAEENKATRLETDEEVDEGDDSDPELAMTRIQRAIHELDWRREEKLRMGNMIGHVRDVLVETTIHINARRVTFRWQRGNKIGQGRFGKVYTAVNTDTGELMALKEIHLQPNDHKTIREVADELRIFEGIKNPYLVRYYGVEIHREEMFIFMEYCDYGTLEHAAELGLPEPQIRKYTRQLLESICVLHEHGIVHRDIKGANIFLTSDGNLKLGDFGCCIKLKNHTTMPGELNSFVGTQAFMAPEVFTKTVTEGHGRAADIWSVGCVVLEMVTGHRPWHELENNYQIMFKVGMGETPEIPYTVSQEGQDFLGHCFRFDPRERWTAISLLDHPFTKVDSDDDFQSMTFLPDAHLFLHKLSLN